MVTLPVLRYLDFIRTASHPAVLLVLAGLLSWLVLALTIIRREKSCQISSHI